MVGGGWLVYAHRRRDLFSACSAVEEALGDHLECPMRASKWEMWVRVDVIDTYFTWTPKFPQWATPGAAPGGPTNIGFKGHGNQQSGQSRLTSPVSSLPCKLGVRVSGAYHEHACCIPRQRRFQPCLSLKFKLVNRSCCAARFSRLRRAHGWTC
jgi:hypothetical protein